MKYGKVWGETKPLIVTPLVEVHEIVINPNTFCSKHYHAFKWNAFYIIEGELEIEVIKNDYKLTDRTILKAGDFTTVKPGEVHRFISGNVPCKALEIYYLEPLKEDIIRESCGGFIYKEETKAKK